MCKTHPGPRCTDHSAKRLDRAAEKHAEAAAAVATAETELAAAQSENRAETRIKRRLSAAEKRERDMLEKQQIAQLEYDSTPGGQREVEKLLRAKDLSEEERANLTARLDTARAYRVWQQRFVAKAKQLEKEKGPEAVLAWAKRENAAQLKRVHQIELELAAKYQADQAKRFKNLPPEQQLRALVTKAAKIYYRINRYRTLYKALTGDLDKFILRHTNALLTKQMTKGTGKLIDLLETKARPAEPKPA